MHVRQIILTALLILSLALNLFDDGRKKDFWGAVGSLVSCAAVLCLLLWGGFFSR